MISLRGLCIGLVVSFVCVGLLVGSVFGAVFVGATYPYGAGEVACGAEITVVHPSATTAYSAYFFTFMTEFDGGNLSYVDLLMFKEGSPVGYVRGGLYNTTSGTYGTTAVPSGSVVENCLVDVSMADLVASPGAYVRFSFSNTTTLSAGVVYVFAVWELNETTCDATNGPRLYVDSAGSYSGNMGYFSSGGWAAAGSTDDEVCFVVAVEGGTAVSYFGFNIYYGDTTVTISGGVNASGDVTVGDITGSINATGAITAGAVSAGNVSAGNVTASGGVSVDVGGVTASFNNTAVSAGDVSAGAVTAGDVSAGAVTASSASATITELVVNATVGDNVTMTGDLNLATTAEPEDFEFWFVLVMILGGFFLAFVPRVPIVNVFFGFVSLSVCGASLGSLILPFPWYMSLLLLLSSIVCLLSAAISIKNRL